MRFWNCVSGLVLALGVTTAPVQAAEGPKDGLKKHHAMSLTGTPKYPADFTHFEWVNPDAPKGGKARLWRPGGFDSLNQFTPKGSSAAALGLIYDSLMISSLDEGSTQYGLIAEWASYPDDFSSVTFKLRDGARFHDGKAITADDVVFSLKALKSAHPFFKLYYRNVKSVEKNADGTVTFTFDQTGNRELPYIVGEMSILPKHWWEAKNANGEARDITKSGLEKQLGSGPYRIGDVKPGRSISYERVKDYWAKDLPVMKGRYNFDQLSFEYFRDSTPAFEAFKSGQIDFWQETSSKRWATAYDFPALKQDKVLKEAITLKRPQPMQAFVFNTRLNKFKDRRVRQALGLAFNFEQANRDLFFDQYTRTNSYFVGGELASSGLPQGKELAILTELKGQVPEEVFTTEYKAPANPDRNAFRKSLRKAKRLLKQAGFKVDNGVLKDKTGAPLEMEFLLVSPAFERVVLPYVKDLQKLGVTATVRLVDSAQYERRLKDFKFDVIVSSFGQSESPGNEQRNFWGSRSAEMSGSRNYIGIQDKAIDALIDKIIFAKSRDDLIAATRALDRVLLWNHFVVPQWFVPYERIAYWKRFDRPKRMPEKSVGFEQIWWASDTPMKEARSLNRAAN